MALKEKIVPFLKIRDEDLGTDCFPSALDIQSRYNGKGHVYWVGDVREHVGMRNALVCHFYYIPPEAKDADLALNQADAGYDEFPALTVGEVKQVGSRED